MRAKQVRFSSIQRLSKAGFERWKGMGWEGRDRMREVLMG